MLYKTALFAAAVLIAGPAAAHIVFAEPSAAAGSYYAGFLRVSHGCGEAGTVSLRVEIPPAVLSARPQPKAGWALTIERAKLPQPVAGEGGATITERVTAVTWTGSLPADEFDQFGLMMKLPASAGPLYFPAVQTCTSGENAWIAIPSDPSQWHSLERPAPMLMVGEMHAMMHEGH
ncbi:MAG: YcnI family protein [Tsuneonella sp.]